MKINLKLIPLEYFNLKNSEIAFLKKMLYEALYVPPEEKPFPRTILDAPEIAKYIENWGDHEQDKAIVAKIDNKLVGAIWGRQFFEDNKGYGFIDNATPEISMAVLAPFRNRGIGKGLIASLETSYKSSGINALSLSVDKRNPAKRLYERMGFSIYHEQKNAITMLKKI